MAALSSLFSRRIWRSTSPMRLAGRMNNGTTATAGPVSRHSRRSMIASVVASVRTLETTLGIVLTTAFWAPTTSLSRRAGISPVLVVVKNRRPSRWRCRYAATRRSKIRRSPTKAV